VSNSGNAKNEKKKGKEELYGGRETKKGKMKEKKKFLV